MNTEKNLINTLNVDRLGELTKQMAQLKKEADAIKDNLKDFCMANDVKKVQGALVTATYVEANRKVVDYKTLCADMGVDSDILGKYTTHNAVFSIKLS
jgi:hypothetical protein